MEIDRDDQIEQLNAYAGLLEAQAVMLRTTNAKQRYTRTTRAEIFHPSVRAAAEHVEHVSEIFVSEIERVARDLRRMFEEAIRREESGG